MKKTFKTLLILCMVVALFASASISANGLEANNDEQMMRADVSRGWTVEDISVPGVNGSTVTEHFNYKGSSDTNASFVCTYKSNNRNFDARIVNRYNESRSSWARDLDLNQIVHAKTTGNALKGYQYYCQVSSALLSFGATDMTIAFSADDLSSLP